MIIHTYENTLKIKNEAGEILDTQVTESYMLYPEKGKLLRDKLTGYTTNSSIGVGGRARINNYEEIDDEKE